MELFRARGLTSYRSGAKGSPRLFDDLEITLSEGDRLALIGPNGSGKSTLLRLFAGASRPSEGSIVRAPGIRVALLEQAFGAPAAGTVWEVASTGLADLVQVEQRLRLEELRITSGYERSAQHQALLAEFESLGGYGARALVREILAALGFPPALHDHHSALLSSGQRQRLALAAVLSSQAAVLLLDEPTNNLDLEARVWLERHLRKRSGSLVLVSHDRDLLAAVTTATATVHDGKLRREAGAYGRKRAWRRRKSAKRRGGEPPNLGGGGAASDQRRVRGRLLSAEHLSLPGVFEGVAVRLDAGDRIALIGPNGSGKSTLLAQLAGDLPSADPRAELSFARGLKLVWVPQSTRGLDPQLPLIEQALSSLGEGAAQRTLADAGLMHESWGRLPNELSGGERARAGLALAMARDFDLLLLDEPDNDLDLAGLEAFEDALGRRLEATSAALIVVTHDRRLASNIANRAWTLGAEGLLAFASVRAYLRGEEPVPARLHWQERLLGSDAHERDEAGGGAGGAGGAGRRGGVSERELAGAVSGGDARAEELEDERNVIVAALFDPLALSDRDLERNERRLLEVEEQLMSLYDERFEPPAPSRKYLERGLEIYADLFTGDRWALVAAPGPGAARQHLLRPGAGGEPWLELRVVAGVANLRLHEPTAACVLTWATGALLEAAVRLAFVTLGAQSTQFFEPDPPQDSARWLHGTNFGPLADGWWVLTLDDFLAQEGWQVT